MLGWWLVSAPRLMAASEFETSYSSIYQVGLNGVTQVVLDISLENKISNVYADRFSLSVGFTDIRNVRVKDAVGLIEPEIVVTDNQTIIRFMFVDKVVGKGKVNRFSVSYETQDIAIKNGSIWEVNIPQLEADKEISSQKVTLIVPSVFGEPAFITPKPDTATNNPPAANTSNSYGFEALTLGNRAISAVFGTEQYMRFNLIYHLENNSPVKQGAEIAIPPDTNYQKMVYESIRPEPENVLIDKDGNWLAQYTLLPGQKLDVSTTGVVKISFNPDGSILNQDMWETYLSSSGYWQVDNAQVQALADKLGSAKSVYDYVTDYLSYDYNKVLTGGGRVGALAALNAPETAICTEFTDLFVTLARAAGIPARELEGYAFTSNDKLRPLSLTQDILHAWPEYYDLQTRRWVQIDPTWGDTTGGVDYFNKLDLNHFVFVIHGSDPVNPLPAGAYKTEVTSNKDVKVIASDPVVMPSEDLMFEAVYKRNWWKGVIELTVKNQGMVAGGGSLVIKSEPEGVVDEVREEVIPPYGERVMLVNTARGKGLIAPSNLLIKNGQREIMVRVEQDEAWGTSVKVAAGAVGATILAAGAYTAVRLLLRRRDR
ncbi:Transglutaminase domain-containing protein [Candidatus Chazhemtobacterium aquaticus]|uniref:Transglutaminase domain-containing protein n=2 Tax=Candidatus Chazhemtobacterium aquaticus TaxID=2715735 RepID=A0A857N8E5_9BACT|nr:Transglutaminase domain-containing protein [Candidatus Chazhemtobacterium aquaticus]